MSKKLAVLDGETTGLDTDRDEFVELCVQIWTPDTGLLTDAEHTFYRLWMPQGEAHPKAAAVNGFSREAWAARGAQFMIAQDLIDLNCFLEKHKPDMWLGCNSDKFDLPLLRSAYNRVRLNMARMSHRTQDIQTHAGALLMGGAVSSISLENLAAWAGVANPAPHTAPGDVWTTAKVYEAQLGYYLRGPAQ